MIFDTDIFLWVQRKNESAADLIDKSVQRYLSIQSYMELLRCTNNKSQHKYIKDFLNEYDFIVLPFTENIGHRASIYIEEYTFSPNLRAGDAIIAASAVEHNMILVSSNAEHFKPIKELQLKIFKP